jgi:hypothetical protein
VASLGDFLSAAIGPLVKRGLSALGVGVVTYVGVDLAVSSLLEQARSAYQGLPSDVAGYLSYGGVPTAFAIICGGLTARVTILSLKKLASL